jgi:dolichol-phosphate mannosyltransferase
VGLLGEYVGRIYTAVQNRPTYFIGHDTAADAARVPLRAGGDPTVPSPASPPGGSADPAAPLPQGLGRRS